MQDGTSGEPNAGLASDLPAGIGNPARRALAAAGYDRLQKLTLLDERELLALHGVGPKAVAVLRQELAAKGLAFAEPGRDRGRR
ncbi:MAG: hypothetical protein AVDCRST_MAG59-2212 [uncultured Thermomicrobiales bacterium]|uniref:DNA-binding protein n=1 Tax=uncultured Thermomicrobiales bacterium TaxID=1645740 RepID=A0A6J4UUR4_9BACT|nr:MAG: hypothetical protein AVDCRST_MAG59-2212 [uncultured Thermomicrobiales bacterium]